ncbi:MAG: dipeptidase [Pseudomonadales bacterium]
MKKTFWMLVILVLCVVIAKMFVPGYFERSRNVVQEFPHKKITPRAQSLHDSLFVADLHTDSLLWDRDIRQASNQGHVDLPRLRQGNVGLQVFSAVTKSPYGQNYDENNAATDVVTALVLLQWWPASTWRSLFERASFQLKRLQTIADEKPNNLVIIRSQSDFKELLERRKTNPDAIGAMFLIEGAHALDGQLDKLDQLHKNGLHFVGLTHFFDNGLGGSLHGISQKGLTEFGRQVIERATALTMNIDIAHASPAMVKEVLSITDRPVILSHGGFKGACNSSRNLDDNLMKEIAKKGGLIGVGYWDGAICDNSPTGIVRSIRYGIDLLGVEHIALGSDYDGTVTTTFDTASLNLLTQAMLDQDFTETEIRAVMGENVKQFLLDQLPE